jgi:hypothetical protein
MLIFEYFISIKLFLFFHMENGKPSSLCYNKRMKKRRISQTNPYLKDKSKRRASIIASVCSSSAIEGISTAHPVIDKLHIKKQAASPHKLSATGQ